MPNDLSYNQQRVLLRFLEAHAAHKAPPTYTEIAQEFGVTSKAILVHVIALEQKGYIERRKEGTRRVVLTDKAHAL